MDLAGNLLWQWQFPILPRPSESIYTFGLTDDDIPPDLDFGDDEDEEEKIQLVFNVGALLPDCRLLVQSTSGQLFELSADNHFG